MTEPYDFGTPGNVKPAEAHCCRALALGWSFVELDRCYKAAVAGETTFIRDSGERENLIPDVLTLAPMLRRGGVVSANPLGGGPFPEPRKVFRCVHNLPGFTCGIYDRRPAMCRDYPTNLRSGRCEYLNCQSTACKFRPQTAAARTQEEQ